MDELAQRSPTPGLLDTILWELSEDCVTRRYYRDGRHHQASFMEGSRLVDFAPPMGRQYVYYVPHTEVTTLPPTSPRCAIAPFAAAGDPELMQDMRVLQRYGLLAGPVLEQTKQRDVALRRRARCVSVDAVRQCRGGRGARRRARSGAPTRSATRRIGDSAAWPG